MFYGLFFGSVIENTVTGTLHCFYGYDRWIL